ncbi:MAG: ABC transporter ATP-binding protein [Fimbriimonadales bacterium]|nr:ABC transporter ATP-binding protein [Fimbriimonadales bacterium]
MLVEAHDLCKSYRTSRGTVNALQGVSLQLREGEIVALLGANGAGKTTFVKCLLGLIYPDGGQVRLCGYDPFRQPQHALAQVGTVLEGSRNVYWQLSAWENLLFFAGIAGVPPRLAQQRAAQLLEQLGLMHRRHDLVGSFSRGMQQKVALAVALIRDPRVLILDEPTLGLDVEAARDLRMYLRRAVDAERRGVLLCTHQMELVEQIADRVVILHRGHVVREGTVAELRSSLRQRLIRVALACPLTPALQQRIYARIPVAQIEERTVAVPASDGAAFYTLTRLLEESEAPIEAVETLTPSLEEVFLEVVRS